MTAEGLARNPNVVDKFWHKRGFAQRSDGDVTVQILVFLLRGKMETIFSIPRGWTVVNTSQAKLFCATRRFILFKPFFLSGRVHLTPSKIQKGFVSSDNS